MTEDESRVLDDDVAGCAAAHQRLLAVLDGGAADGSIDPRAPSRLPDWTIGHVLTHLARNADAFRRMLDGAAAGERRRMYASAEQRDADIEAGSPRPLADLISDVRRATWALESTWSQLTAAAWRGHGIARTGTIPVAEIPWRRWREVEVHHADLGLSDGPAEWSSAFVARDLPEQRAEWEADGNVLPDEVANAQPWQQLAWLFGRASGLETPPPKWA